jgi:N-acetylglucosamine kinase-like BadF-type ATPase
MLVVADSGSTKCDWIFKEGNNQVEVSTQGYNPMFHNAEFITSDLKKYDDIVNNAEKVKELYFYGAGCSSDRLKSIAREGLEKIFPNAKILVEHDLDGAVYAACHGKPGIACILGTGSNSAYFDGEKIHEEVPALGYILGDEGSGSYFGKQLLSRYLYKQLPAHIQILFEKEFPDLTSDDVFNGVYMKPHANVYLASFMKFLSDNREDRYIQDMVYHGLSRFIDIHIWQYRNFKSVPVHFVGSIAYFFENVLRKAANNHRIQMGRIIRRPVEHLLEYHN